MKHQLLRLALAVPLLLLCAWPRTSVGQAAITYAVVAWGDQPIPIPLAAQSGVTAIAAGSSHIVALKNDGSVVAWGSNSAGQTTIPPAAQSGVTAIAAGGSHTVALKNDGSVVAWGNNGNGQVTGTPTTNAPYSAIAIPVTLGGQVLSGVTAIAAGGFHTVALKSDGTVVAWGRNDEGQTRIPLPAQSGVTAIAAGGDQTVALKNDGSVVVWGNNAYGQRTIPLVARSGVTAIAAAGDHTVALKNDGSVVAWGYNAYGQTTVPVAAQSGVTAIAAGNGHTVALKNDGSVVAWGNNNNGQTTIPLVAQGRVAAIAAGGAYTVALVVPTAPNITTQPLGQAVNVWQSAGFTVVATGYPLNYQWRKDGVDLAGETSATYGLTFAQTNQAGNYTVVVSNPIGSVTSAPPAVLTVNPVAAPGTAVTWYGQSTVPLTGQSGVVAIAAGSVCEFGKCHGYDVALKSDGSVVAWGYNAYGQTTVPVAAQSGVTAIAAGGSHTVALKNDGTVVAWGWNTQGQVTGTPATDEPYYAIASPVTLGGEVLSRVTAIAAGEYHIVALKNDGTVVAWGWNTQGQVTGTPATDEPYYAIASPVTRGGEVLSGVTAIAAGMRHTVALKKDGTVVAWGYNGDGQVTGTPTDDFIASPVTLGGQALGGVTAIAAGGWHSVALKNDGSVVAWGANWNGQATVPVAAKSEVTKIAAGYSHSVGLKNDGTVVEWGVNAVASPVTLGGQVLSGVTAIAAGWAHTVALIGGVQLLPSLNARPNGNELILSWPTNAVGFTLQSTLDLTPPVNWLDSTSLPAVIGSHFTLTNTTSGGAQLYRLRKM